MCAGVLTEDALVEGFDLLSDGSLVGLGADELLGLHQGVDEVVDALVQVG